MKDIKTYLNEGRVDYIETAKLVTDKLKNMKCPKPGEEIYIDIPDNRQIYICNDDKSAYKSICAYLMRDGKIVEHTKVGIWYGKEYLSGKNISQEEAWEKLKKKLKYNNEEIYNR